MNLKEKIKKIKMVLAGETVEETQKFVDVKDADGNLFRIDGEIAEGSTIQKIEEDGTLTAVTDGDYNIDGVDIVVKDGKIEEIKTEETVVEPGGESQTEMEKFEDTIEEETKEEEPKEEEGETVEKRMEVIEVRMEAIETAVNQLLEAITVSEENLSEVKQEVEKLGQTPATFSQTDKKNQTAKAPSKLKFVSIVENKRN